MDGITLVLIGLGAGALAGPFGLTRRAESMGDVTLRRVFALFLAVVAVKVWIS